MNFNNTLETDMLDILFANRNKTYGAYQLRKNYNKRLLNSILAMTSICVLGSAFIKWKASHTVVSSPTIVSGVINLGKVETKKLIPVPPLTVKVKPIERIQVATIKVTTPQIVNDKLVSEPPPTQDAMQGVKIDLTSREGVADDREAPPVEQTIGFGESLVKTEDFTKEFYTVQKQAQFPGGLEAWKKFLEQNLRSTLPAENGATVGSYTVVISFLVDREGNISEVKADNDPGFGTAAEAVRVIQRGPAWTPAVQNGRNVIYRQKQSITFVVSE